LAGFEVALNGAQVCLQRSCHDRKAALPQALYCGCDADTSEETLAQSQLLQPLARGAGKLAPGLEPPPSRIIASKSWNVLFGCGGCKWLRIRATPFRNVRWR